jgi:hypothetical protein
MTKALATFECDATKWSRSVESCARRGENPAALMSDFVRLKLKNWDRPQRRANEVSDELLVRLRLLVAEALAASRSWSELAFELDSRGLAYQPSGGGLVLIDAHTGEILCKGSLAGPPYRQLIKRFKALHPSDHKHDSAPLNQGDALAA